MLSLHYLYNLNHEGFPFLEEEEEEDEEDETDFSLPSASTDTAPACVCDVEDDEDFADISTRAFPWGKREAEMAGAAA